MSNSLVVIMGIGTVFIGLISIIIICTLMGEICKLFIKEKKVAPAKAPNKPAQPSLAKSAPVENKQEIIAACCAAVAEELGTDVSGIKVVSFKRV